ncbi:prevent-host-death family protein [Azospirillum fermentarium]|uniref:type II toxin-antitoxin system Phd/YefM family antitoxin n=1 Tax=Azospirillum fermentarium TaxID=1233114 RepID=UPI0022270355|nr:type II toxin-antitoxin system prevent-host-death family antitoxin [Azospirillum fermentarium]MCW2245026.1 prevent-host-death family protein [Azospirillum fermentarium]
MKMLSVEEASTQLAALVEDARRGEEVVLTSGGRPVARLTPAAMDKPSPEEVRAFLTSMKKGLPIGGRDWTRDELYESRLKP